ncbi:uncharacterized protein LOC115308810 [Ixodes scapularis]|uniref:uncharacterized protein LOC115308810 n=1 Tax=Ixodes scapularis TaxID=6945 RepID=UPI001A9E8629|nr:uncharacterized protein LOC115308810 [Ixodes scapularis]XP_040061185.1 uncharacterized protein LOC115308810 [Ixodes scapularis]XP_040061187.1 uncharacterized protein LOC115308810 [Ixodes scapularis]XP_042142766.1 uncharacterized protein LOC115308810 [Ixodes scapularis]
MKSVEEAPKDKIEAVCDALALPRLQKDDQKLIEEYCQTMKRVTKALDILQGERYMFMGASVPTLMALMRQLHSQPTLKFSSSLADTVKIAVMSRFSEDLRSDELLLDTVVHPNLKFHGFMKRRKRILCFLKRNVTHCALPRKLHGSQQAMKTTTTTTPSCDCVLMLNLPVKHSNGRLTPHQRRYLASTTFPALRCFYASMPHFLLAHLSNVFSARGGRFSTSRGES